MPHKRHPSGLILCCVSSQFPHTSIGMLKMSRIALQGLTYIPPCKAKTLSIKIFRHRELTQEWKCNSMLYFHSFFAYFQSSHLYS